MNRILINIDALRDNYLTLCKYLAAHQASWTVVTKALCGHADTVQALHQFGASSFADTRLANLETIKRCAPSAQLWYLRPPHLSAARDVVALTDVSLNTEPRVIKALGKEAIRQNKTHGVILMVEMGELREGILPGRLPRIYEELVQTPGINIIGIGSQMGCLNGSVPSEEQISLLLLLREFLELKYSARLPILSGGSSIFLPMLLEGRVHGDFNHFRIGDSLFLGTDIINGGVLPGMRDDVITLEAEVIEVKQKSLNPSVETMESTPFSRVDDDGDNSSPTPGERGYRALVAVGQLDTEVGGLTPINKSYKIAGASSDIAVINLGPSQGDLQVGSSISFRCNYAAFVRLMNGSDIPKHTISSCKVEGAFPSEQAGPHSFDRSPVAGAA